MICSQGNMKCNFSCKMQVVYKIKYTTSKFRNSYEQLPEGRLRQAMGGLQMLVMGCMMRRQMWNRLWFLSAHELLSLSLATSFPSRFFFFLFFLSSNILLIPGTAGHEGLLINRCHLYAALPFCFLSLSISLMPVPHTRACMHTDTHTS